MRRFDLLVALSVLVFLPGPVGVASAGSDPLQTIVEDILAVYDHKNLVCLGERHGSKLDSDLRIRLVQHPDFPRKVEVILVEFATESQQELLDRFIAGEDVPLEEVRWVWRDTGFRVWDSPIYEAFLRAVRRVNLDLPQEQRLQVIAGDVPRDWSRINSWEDMPAVINRGSYPIGVIDKEVLSKGLKGLAIYGAGHCERWGIGFTPEVEERYPGQVWVAESPGPEHLEHLRSVLELGQEPALILVKDSPVADRRALEFIPSGDFRNPAKVAEVVDALIYYGALEDEIVYPDPSIYNDPEYARELERRGKILNRWAEEQRKRMREE